MSPTTIRSITGPLLLILTGSLFLYDYSGGYSFRESWPALLIAVGVSKVLERMVSGPARQDGR